MTASAAQLERIEHLMSGLDLVEGAALETLGTALWDLGRWRAAGEKNGQVLRALKDGVREALGRVVQP